MVDLLVDTAVLGPLAPFYANQQCSTRAARVQRRGDEALISETRAGGNKRRRHFRNGKFRCSFSVHGDPLIAGDFTLRALKIWKPEVAAPGIRKTVFAALMI